MSQGIREAIAKIPQDELANTYPKQLLPMLKNAGFTINNSFRTRVGQLLQEAKGVKPRKSTKHAKNTAAIIREVLNEIAVSDLPNTYPRHVVAKLKSKGCKITKYVLSKSSSVLSKLKRGDKTTKSNDVWSVISERTNLVAKLIDNCGGCCNTAIAEIERVQKIMARQ